MVGRATRAAKNARWYLIDTRGSSKVGWGDLSFDDLDLVHGDLTSAVFVAVRSNPLRSNNPESPWLWYDRPDPEPGPTIEEICEAAHLAVLPDVGPVIVGRGELYRRGNILDLHGYTLPALRDSELLEICRAVTTSSP
jgi:hypothetical protein